VPTEADKAAAEQIARAVNGVRDVQNELVVASAGTGSSPAASPSTR
jgi:osmotically-inducible protein OsmY